MRIGVLVNSSFYVVTYIAEDSKFSDYEEVVNRMIKSLRIPPETSSSSDQEYVYRDPKTDTKMTLKYPSTGYWPNKDTVVQTLHFIHHLITHQTIIWIT